PGVFASYLRELEQKHGKRVTAYTFRDKRLGWKNFSAVATFEDGSEHVGQQTTEPFLYGFLQNLYLRPSCAVCTALRGEHHPSDITIADLWGAEHVCPDRDDDSGLSLVFVNTQKGRKALEAANAQLTQFPVPDTQQLLRLNPSLEHAASAHPKRKAFFKLFSRKGFDSAHVMKLLAGPSRLERIAGRIAHLPKGLARRIGVLAGRLKK
ncbi:MAG: Coenzyme F420 hydrogenase/dehydrogenase, beta subunit C-terminal domain, partial [Clostridia bacterium]|nr:Coenzyme F420 hydrogenase/dehydrogenase, beta subunit C-terminal domain [Clostridia bacterium]